MRTFVRRWYGFNSAALVAQHCSEVCTEADLIQLAFDIQSADCNLTKFIQGVPGVFAVDCAAGNEPERHVFMTRQAYESLGATEEELAWWASFKVLES